MSIPACDLRILEQKGIRFHYGRECRLVCLVASIMGVVVVFVALDNYDLSSYTFTNLAGMGGTLTVVGLIAFRSITAQLPPYSDKERKIYHDKKPLTQYIIYSIAQDLCAEDINKTKSKIKLYKLSSSDIYFDYEFGKTTVTASLRHLLESISWKELVIDNLPKKYLSHYVGLGLNLLYGDADSYLAFNRFLRSKGTEPRSKFACDLGFRKKSYDKEKRLLFKVMCTASEMNTSKKKVEPNTRLYRATNLPSSHAKMHKVGAIICDPGFWSTSKTWKKAFAVGPHKKFFYTITKSKNGVDIDNKAEQEILFPPFTSFKITSKNYNKIEDAYEVSLEEVY